MKPSDGAVGFSPRAAVRVLTPASPSMRCESFQMLAWVDASDGLKVTQETNLLNAVHFQTGLGQ